MKQARDFETFDIIGLLNSEESPLGFEEAFLRQPDLIDEEMEHDEMNHVLGTMGHSEQPDGPLEQHFRDENSVFACTNPRGDQMDYLSSVKCVGSSLSDTEIMAKPYTIRSIREEIDEWERTYMTYIFQAIAQVSMTETWQSGNYRWMSWSLMRQRLALEDSDLTKTLQRAAEEAGFSWDNLKVWHALYREGWDYTHGIDLAVQGGDRYDLFWAKGIIEEHRQNLTKVTPFYLTKFIPDILVAVMNLEKLVQRMLDGSIKEVNIADVAPREIIYRI